MHLTGDAEGRAFQHLGRGAGVGGGSLIYANVSVEPAAVAFEQGWPQEITHAELVPFVDQVGEHGDGRDVDVGYAFAVEEHDGWFRVGGVDGVDDP